MDQRDLLRKALEAFAVAGVEYLLVGSIASAVYGEPRLTLDIDVVAVLTVEKLPRFLSAFPPSDYYVSAEAATDAIRSRKQFNIIHPSSGLKIDIIVAKADAFDIGRFARKRSISVFPDRPADFASPEDVIIKKMEYYRESESEKHLRDITGILRVSGDGLDFPYIEDWSISKGLTEIWRAILAKTMG